MAARPDQDSSEEWSEPEDLSTALALVTGPEPLPLAVVEEVDEAWDDPLLRKLKRAALRKKRVMVVEGSPSPSFSRSASREKGKKKRNNRSRSREKRKEAGDRQALMHMQMMSALRPDGMVHQGIRSGQLDVVTGGHGFGGPAPLAMGGLMGAAANANPDGKKVCMKFLVGQCPLGANCLQNHPPTPLEINRWVAYFNKQPCKFGDQCPADRCIYMHPNKATYTGVRTFVTGTSL